MSAPITLAITNDSAQDAGDPDRLEPSDERIQRIGNDDAEQQRHHEGLRPRQCEDGRERRQDSQRKASRVDLRPRRGKSDVRRVRVALPASRRDAPDQWCPIFMGMAAGFMAFSRA